MVGGGVVSAGMYEEVIKIAEKINIPVVSNSLMGLGVFKADHPQFLGLTGMHGSKVANNAAHIVQM